MFMNKTLIGKDNYLFLINDSAKELEVHCNNVCLVNSPLTRYDTVKHKMLFIVFPNKSLIQKNFLPDKYIAKFRPAFNLYKQYFGDKIIDGAQFVSEHMYYKTDTHINLLGAYIIFNEWVSCVNSLFNLSISPIIVDIQKLHVTSLSELQIGLGDLTWATNLGNQTLLSQDDTYYFSEHIPIVYTKYIINSENENSIQLLDNSLKNITNEFNQKIIDWNIISTTIIYVKQNNKINKRVVIFYDSFLLSTLSLYLSLFNEIFMIKDIFKYDIINKINPDLIFEFRCERFLF